MDFVGTFVLTATSAQRQASNLQAGAQLMPHIAPLSFGGHVVAHKRQNISSVSGCHCFVDGSSKLPAQLEIADQGIISAPWNCLMTK